MLKSAITCGNINDLSTWDDANCEGVLYSCKKDPAANACIPKSCADYRTKADGTTAVVTSLDCSTLNSTCTIDNTAGAV